MPNSSARKHFFFAQFSYSLLTKESLFCRQREPLFFKVGKVTFFARKSLLCRYSALSLHSKTVGKWPISDSFSRSAFALPPLLRLETKWIQNGMKETSTLYKVRAERACSLCRAKPRHEVTSPTHLAEGPLFFWKSGTLILGFFGITISNMETPCLRRAFVVPSLFPSLLWWI